MLASATDSLEVGTQAPMVTLDVGQVAFAIHLIISLPKIHVDHPAKF